MGRTIAIANQKGGVGKTTTAINLSSCLVEAGQRVLTIDFDPQGNATQGVGAKSKGNKLSVYNLVMEDYEVEDMAESLQMPPIDVIPASISLAGADLQMVKYEVGKEELLKKKLDKVRDKYDFIIIDCPPLGSVVDALIAGRISDGVALVVASEAISYKFAQKIKKQLEMAECKILGVVLNKVNLKRGGYYGKYYGKYYGEYYTNEE